VLLEGLGKLKKSNDLLRNRTHYFLPCSIVPQPTTLPRVTIAAVLLSTDTHDTSAVVIHTGRIFGTDFLLYIFAAWFAFFTSLSVAEVTSALWLLVPLQCNLDLMVLG
jgi:hypothetical protein